MSDRDSPESIAEHNQRVRERDKCEECGADLPDKDADHRYAQAAGALAGPFCSRDCYWDFFVESLQDDSEGHYD